MRQLTDWFNRTVIARCVLVSIASVGILNSGRAAQLDRPLPALTASAGFWADIDKDGLMDVLLVGATTNETVTRLYRNNGDGTFRDLEAGFAPLGSAVAAWGDYNNDGNLDLAIAGQDNAGRAVTQIYRNEGNGVFTNIAAALDGVIPTIIQWLDFDNDGDIDLYVSGTTPSTQSTVSTLYRNERGMFLVQSIRPKSLRQGVWGDFDGDGDPDLVSRGFLQRNDGDGGFSILERPDSSVPLYGSLAADYDEDGDLDVVVVGDLVTAVMAILQNDGAAGFQTQQQPMPLFPDVVRWGDFNGDDKLDLLIAGGSEIRVYQRPNGTWSYLVGLASIYFGGLNHTDWVDIDGDGDLDVCYTGPRSAQPGDYVTGFHTNTIASSIVPIGIPASLQAMANGDEIRLRWDPPQTPVMGLTYNIRIGTAPGGIDVVTPNASVTTGHRWLHASGNSAVMNHHWLRLPMGRYYWSVQAINAAYVGGMFADEGTFEITNSRPFISELADRSTPISQPTPPIPFTVSDAQTSPADLVIVASSSNTNLVPADGMIFEGAGSNRTLRVFPTAGATGQVTIAVTVRDPQGANSSSQFELTIPHRFSLLQATLPKLTNPILTWGDLDTDSHLDLLVGGTDPAGRPVTINNQVYIIYDGVLSVFRNNGEGNLTDTGIPVLGVNSLFLPHAKGLRYGTISLNDLEGDGDIDLLISGEYAAPYFVSDVYKNSGDASFQPLGLGYPQYQFRSYNSWEDLDNDGLPDILMGGRLATRLYRNLGASSFGALTNLPGHVTGSTAWLDADNDADNDLLLILTDYAGDFSNPPDRSHLYLNDGFGNLMDSAISLPNLAWSSVAPADFDGDGWVDFVLSGTSNYTNNAVGATTQLYHNEHGSFFRRIDVPFVPVYSAVLSWVDYDNDGDWDLLVAGSTTNGLPVTRLYRNEGGGAFVEDNVGLPDLATPSVAWGDYDLDGDLDLAISGTTTNGLFSGLFRNERGPSNIRPVPPAELQVTLLPDNGARLTWATGNDLETANAAALTYAVRVGTDSGGQSIVAALSASASGIRRVAQSGQRQRSLRLPDLPRGEYFWSVQTIDSALEGSLFADEARFTITNTRPTISSRPDLRTVPNTLVTNAPFIVGDLETPADELILSATSSDTNLVPVGNIFFGGAGSNRTVTILPTSLVGTSVVTVTVRDADDGRRGSSFAVRVVEFSEVGGLFPTLNISNFCWGDYDRDGDLDLLTIGNSSGTNFAKLFRNHDGGIFDEVNVQFPISGPGTVLWSDFDNDGQLDILLTGTNGSWVLRNLGNDLFVDLQLGLPVVSGSSAVAFDYDNDGDKDFLMSGFQPGRGSIARLYRNDGSHKFSNIQFIPVAVTGGTIVTGDLDNDGDIDLLTSGRIENEARTILAIFTRLFRNDGNGVFSPAGPSLPSIARSAALGDYDNDGDLDILLNLDNGSSAQNRPFLFRNNGNWAFSETVTTLPAFDRGTAAWGDYDNDGRLDILLTGRLGGAPTSKVYRNNGNSTFSEIMAPLPGVQLGASSWSDYDNDGRLDLTVSGGPLRLLRNLFPSTNSLPATPTNLESTVLSGGRVVLSWDQGTDQSSSSATAIGFNLQVGSTSSGQEIMSPSSDLFTGYRRMAALGNAGTTNSWKLNLPPGTYYWRVQSIDSSFAGSEFSTEQSFSITAPVVERFSPIGGNQFYLQFSGSSTLLYSVMFSSDLTNWSLLGPANETAPGVFEFTITNGVASQGFIRIRTP